MTPQDIPAGQARCKPAALAAHRSEKTLKYPRNTAGGPRDTTPGNRRTNRESEAATLPRQPTALSQRAAKLRSVGQTWEHFRALGLTSETVAETLRSILREAA